MCRYTLSAPGKLMRPVLLLQSAVAVGGTADQVLPAAVGTEIGHAGSLVHDDIIDGDELRRGQSAAHAKFGRDDAMLAGDALFFDLFRCLAECRRSGIPDSRIVTAMEIVSQVGIDLCRGQILESDLTHGSSHDLETYLAMITLKTASLFGGACRVGAVLGGGRQHQIDALGQFGTELGIAFQISDDLLIYTGLSDEAAGKPLLSDIRNKRMTLPIILAYRYGEPDVGRLLDDAFNSYYAPAARLANIRAALARCHALERSRELARDRCERALAALQELPPNQSREELAGHVALVADGIR
jgi:geranylgeranyl pyrophosphate synthase